jgi:cellulose synthase/poly-beta-1,6-N-acetylglucosamine synthase-like glycosyltransferase
MFFIYLALKLVIKEYFNQKLHISNMILSSNAYDAISIIAPAYNEEKTIVSSINSLIDLQFPTYEVIVVSDGSSDNTMAQLLDNFDLYEVDKNISKKLNHQQIDKIYHSKKYKNLVVVDKQNGGKADALNCGINISKYPLFCCIDADSLLEPKAITRAISSFVEQRDTIAVGGTIGILNGYNQKNRDKKLRDAPKKLIEKFQSLEYLRGFLAGRTGWIDSNGLLIISGAFGIFKKDIVQNIGGYRETIGEDFDLVVRMRKYCYDNNISHKILFVPQTMCWTQAPSDYMSLLKQRNRWHRGLLETLFFNKNMIFNPKYKIVGILSLPYFLLIEAAGPIITFIGILAILTLYFYGMISQYTIILFFLLEFSWGILLNTSSLLLNIFTPHTYSKKGLISLILASFLEPFYYKPLLKIELFLASFNFTNKKWGKIKRDKI